MSRPLRIELENGLYHVTARGWERGVIVDSDRDREDWLRLLDPVATRCNWRVFAWVLMSNHYLCEASHNIFISFCERPSRICPRACMT